MFPFCSGAGNSTATFNPKEDQPEPGKEGFFACMEGIRPELGSNIEQSLCKQKTASPQRRRIETSDARERSWWNARGSWDGWRSHHRVPSARVRPRNSRLQERKDFSGEALLALTDSVRIQHRSQRCGPLKTKCVADK
jgi:hypothetical protein